MCGKPTPKQHRNVQADRRRPVAQAEDPTEATKSMAVVIVLSLLAAVFVVAVLGTSGAFAKETAPVGTSLVTGIAPASAGTPSLTGGDFGAPRAGEASASKYDQLPALSDVFIGRSPGPD